MEDSRKKLLVQATKALRLNDIALFEARFERPAADSGEATEAFQQFKRNVAYTVGTTTSEAPDKPRLLQVRVSLGTRVVQNQEDAKPLFVIEADYLVEYTLLEDVPEDALKAFAEFCAIHNVWPFWREHVFSIVGRGRLPRLEVPLYEGVAL